jgi:drug/metabolite transporter (DMT)-like permease
MLKPLALGILSSFFFAITFVLNRRMHAEGGHWIWTASLRYLFMFPILFALLLPGKKYVCALREMKKDIGGWLLWSTVGFGFFYAFLCAASTLAPSWMIASTWQITIVAGMLLSPLFRTNGGGSANGVGIANGDLRNARHVIPVWQFLVSLVMLSGVFLVQYQKGSFTSGTVTFMPALLVAIAAFSYPLGNRKMMAVASDSMGTVERVFGMTLCSLPFLFILIAVALWLGHTPTVAQVGQSAIVALFSGVVATILFFKATELVRHDMRLLAVVESTQAGEVAFTVLLGLFLFDDPVPSPVAAAGIAIIILGMMLNAFKPARK